MKLRWETFEDQVRDIAAHVYGRACSPRRLAGSNIDGVIDVDLDTLILLEITTDHTVAKVRGDVVKLSNVRNALYLEGKFARCLVVTQKAPTQGMLDGAATNNTQIMSINELAAQFFEYERYRIARLGYAFGSAVSPESGSIDKTRYIPVPYIDRATGKTYSHTEIGERLLTGKNVVVIGEYGSGKSRCVSEVFDYISKEWGATFKFVIAVNLRECWGLEDADELIRRHLVD